jgi:hypothetical protein
VVGPNLRKKRFIFVVCFQRPNLKTLVSANKAISISSSLQPQSYQTEMATTSVSAMTLVVSTTNLLEYLEMYRQRNGYLYVSKGGKVSARTAFVAASKISGKTKRRSKKGQYRVVLPVRYVSGIDVLSMPFEREGEGANHYRFYAKPTLMHKVAIAHRLKQITAYIHTFD